LANASRNASSLAVEYQEVIHCQRGDATGVTISAEELDLEAIWRKKLDDGTDIADLDRWFAAAIEHGHNVE
jgi:hypothetical protein